MQPIESHAFVEQLSLASHHSQGDCVRHCQSECSAKSLLTMCEIVRERPYAALEVAAGSDETDNMRIAIWRNHVIEFSRAERLANHTISLQLSGDRVMRMDTKKPAVIPGRFAILPAQSSSTWQSDGETRFAHIYFSKDFLDILAAEAFHAYPDRFELKEHDLVRDEQANRLIASAVNLFLGHHQPTPLETNALAQLLGVHLIRHYSNLFAPSDSHSSERLTNIQLATVVEFIDANLERSLSIKELAAVLNFSQYHFLRAFRNTLSETPRKYLLNRRIAKAQELIQQKELSLSEIAYRVGFSSQSHMTTAFKQELNITPSQYAKAIVGVNTRRIEM